MPPRHSRWLLPGERPTAAESNRLAEAAEAAARAEGTGDLEVAAGRDGLVVVDRRPQPIWGRITSTGANPYAWVQVDDTTAALDDLVAAGFGLSGTTTELPAHEANGRTDVPVGTRVRLALSPAGTYFVFQYAEGTGPGFFARITSSSSGKWKWVALTLDGTPAPADDGAESAGYTAVPHSPSGAATPAPVAGDRVWMWPSKQAGYYEFVALETFRASGSGHSRGLVPDPPSKAGTTLYLREDATWVAPPYPSTTASDKTTIDRVSSASISVDGSGVITLAAPKKHAYHPFTAEGFCVVSITEGSAVASDSAITLTDTTSAFWVTDNVTGTVRVHAKMPVEVLAADYELVDADDRGRLLTFTGTRTVTCPDPNPDFPDGWFCDIESRDAVVTLVRETAATIDGATSLTLPAGQGVRLVSDGTQWFTQRGLEPKASKASVLIGRGSKSGAGDRQELAAGVALVISGTDLDVDLTPDSTTTETLVTDVTLAMSGGNLRLARTRVTYTNHFNADGLLVDRTAGSPTTTNTDLSPCLFASCCDAEELTVAAAVDPASGGVETEFDFTATPAGGVEPYTYLWTFEGGDPATSTDQNPAGVTFDELGTFDYSVTVTDACGNTAEDGGTVEIECDAGEAGACGIVSVAGPLSDAYIRTGLCCPGDVSLSAAFKPGSWGGSPNDAPNIYATTTGFANHVAFDWYEVESKWRLLVDGSVLQSHSGDQPPTDGTAVDMELTRVGSTWTGTVTWSGLGSPVVLADTGPTWTVNEAYWTPHDATGGTGTVEDICMEYL